MFELRVLSGLHQGAALPLVGEQWMIGADDELDLALHDPGVAKQHCRLQRQGEQWSLNAEDGAVVDGEGHAHPATTLQPNTPFALGSVWLALCAADQAWPAVPVPQAKGHAEQPTEPGADTKERPLPSPRPSIFSRLSLIVVGALIGVVGSAWSLSYSVSSTDSAKGAAAAHEKPMAAPVRPDDHRTLLNPDQAAAKLRTLLSERLLNDVTLEQTPKGLVLHGNLQEEARLVYDRMMQRFDSLYRTPIAVIDEVSKGTSALPFVIVQILSGPNAHLVTADGKRLYIGDELDGLRLTRIDDGRVQFEGDRHYEVNW
jgi:type III secretion protein D